MVCECVEKIGKDPIAVRIVTNVVLMISDADVIFSWLFIANLFQVGDDDPLYFYFSFVVIVGVLTYALGCLYLAPRQKTKIAKNVMGFISAHPTECVTKDYYASGPNSFKRIEPGGVAPTGKEVTITRAMFVYPPDALAPGSRNPKIGDLDLNEPNNRETLRQGLAQWGLGAIWDAQEQRNAWNCAEMKHGIPFFRLARFGFMSQPTPKDLGSILNMNALYSFATGILQLTFGCVLLARTYSSDDMDMSGRLMIIIPLGISGASLILSVFNVVFDFAGKLSETECEKRMSDTILQKSDLDLKDAKKKRERDHRIKIQEVEEKYKKQIDDLQGQHENEAIKFSLVKDTEIQRLTQQYAMDLRALDERNLTILEIELNGYRHKKHRVKQILMGNEVPIDNQAKVDALQNAIGIKEAHQKIENKITAWYKDRLDELAEEVDVLSVEKYKEKAEKLKSDYEARLKVAKEAQEGSEIAVEFDNAQGR